jgi:hypothetical protein
MLPETRRHQEACDLHERLASMSMAERTSALIVSILDAPDHGAVRQIARAIAVLEIMAARMNTHDKIVASLLFAAASAELLGKDDGQPKWH